MTSLPKVVTYLSFAKNVSVDISVRCNPFIAVMQGPRVAEWR